MHVHIREMHIHIEGLPAIQQSLARIEGILIPMAETTEDTAARIARVGAKLDEIKSDITALIEIAQREPSTPQAITDALAELESKANDAADDFTPPAENQA